MGDRIVIDITDGTDHTPSFYGHWCGAEAIKIMNDVFREQDSNGINSMMCNFLVEVMGRKPHCYSYYIHNYGEMRGSADWDNYTWCLNAKTGTWTTTFPGFEGKTLSLEDAEQFVKTYRPDLYADGHLNR